MGESTMAMFDLAARYDAVREETHHAIQDVITSGVFIGGPWVERAEALCAQWLQRQHAVGLNSGTDALLLALQALEIGEGDEVIVPALSFIATASAVRMTSATPIVVDVRDDGLIDPNEVARATTSRTRAVIPVHLFGAPAPALSLDSIAIIDDAAQAIGADLTGRCGVLTAVSAYPTKPWGAMGDAGFVAGDDPELIDRVKRLGHHGTIGPHHHEQVGPHVGRNSRLDAIQAACLVAQSPTVSTRLKRRREIAARYDQGLPKAITPLARGDDSALHHYVVRVPERDRVRLALHNAGIATAVYYPRPLNEQPLLDGIMGPPTPTAKQLCAELLALPSHAFLRDQDIDGALAVLHDVVG